jgi:hypothetical protein
MLTIVQLGPWVPGMYLRTAKRRNADGSETRYD